MRRFSLTLILALLFVYVLLPERYGQPVSNAASQQPAATKAESAGLAQREAGVAAPEAAIAEKQGPEQTAAIAQTDTAANADSETVAPAHIHSSVDASASDPAFASISDADLVTAAQKQLAKLGCYKAGVDGVWGKKSRRAVREFNRRTGGNWDDDPTRGLISALASAPADLCELPCKGGGSAGQCKVAYVPATGKTKPEGKNEQRDYLPPWMRGERLASLEPEAKARGAIIKDAASTGYAASNKPAVKKTERRANEKRYRTAEQRRQVRRADNWNLVNWPGAAN